MRVDSINSRLVMTNSREKVEKSESDNFFNTLLNRIGNAKDSYVETKSESIYLCEGYNNLFDFSSKSGFIKPVETERYRIEEKESGYVRIYDKERDECFNWKVNENEIQIDKRTGTKFLINDLGVGFFNMVTVDDELEAGLKEALGVDELQEKELAGFTVHKDEKTGIQYITANGYESRGGLLVLDKEGMEKLDSLAKEFMEQYPNLVKTYNEAWFYATFEVRGLLKRTSNGVMMISPNSISFKNKDGINRWVSIFNPQSWKQVKDEFDSGENIGKMEKWDFWKDFFERLKIDASLVRPDNSYDSVTSELIKVPDQQFKKFMSLCLM